MFLISSGLTQLNSRLTNVEEGIGLDTKCVVKGGLVVGITNYAASLAMIYRDDGTFWSQSYSGSPSTIINQINDNTDLFSVANGAGGSTLNTVIVTVLKDGYYTTFGTVNGTTPGFTPALLTAGTTITFAWSYGGVNGYPYSFGILYCGTSVPN